MSGGAVMEWQPIETAPKHGAFVLVWDAPGDDYPCALVAAYVDAPRSGWREQGGYYFATPTHWMPLPEPPKP